MVSFDTENNWDSKTFSKKMSMRFLCITARRSARKAKKGEGETSSPPSQRRRVESPAVDAGQPSSPAAPPSNTPGESSLFSSPPQSRAGGKTVKLYYYNEYQTFSSSRF